MLNIAHSSPVMKIQRDGRRLSKYVWAVFRDDSILNLLFYMDKEKMGNKGVSLVSSRCRRNLKFVVVLQFFCFAL